MSRLALIWSVLTGNFLAFSICDVIYLLPTIPIYSAIFYLPECSRAFWVFMQQWGFETLNQLLCPIMCYIHASSNHKLRTMLSFSCPSQASVFVNKGLVVENSFLLRMLLPNATNIWEWLPCCSRGSQIYSIQGKRFCLKILVLVRAIGYHTEMRLNDWALQLICWIGK